MTLEDCPIALGFYRQLLKNKGLMMGRSTLRDTPVDLTKLWDAAGRPPGKSPRQWAAVKALAEGEEVLLPPTAGASDSITAPTRSAVAYVCYLDPGAWDVLGSYITDFVGGDAVASLIEDPTRSFAPDAVGSLIGNPTRSVAAVAIGHFISTRGVDADQAARILLDEAVRRTAALDLFAQETLMARIERAIRGDTWPEDEGGGPLCREDSPGSSPRSK